MKLSKKNFIITSWILLIFILKENGLITLNIDLVKQYLTQNTIYAIGGFILLWIIRLVAFVPGITLMVLGGACFGPIKGFLLSMIGMVLSETLIFFVPKLFKARNFKNIINNKYPEMNDLVEKYNWRFLALGIICPIAPTDVICFLAASSGIKYGKYIVTVIIANTPLILLYSYMGVGYENSMYTIVVIVLSITLITYYSLREWYNIKNKVRLN